MTPDYDVLIVGGGPVGAAAVLALGGTGMRVGLVEARGSQAASADPRPIALSHGSRLILERFGLWESLRSATPIERIHISQRGGFGRVELNAQEARLPALGYVVDYGQLAVALGRALEAGNCCELIRARVRAVESDSSAAVADLEGGIAGRISARLLVVADGGALAAPTRTRDYHQTVVTTRVACAMPHRNVAYERFTPKGPIALLPMGEGMALVWTTTPEHAQLLCELPEPEFLEQLHNAFGNRLGRFSHAGTRSSYPVLLKITDRIAESRIVALGNAAQTLHPVAGQGLNIGLRDAWELAATVREREPHEVGTPMQLERYRSRRRLDRSGGIGFTDALVRLFSNDIAPIKLARGLGLAALGAVAPAREFVIRRMTFGARG